MGNFILLKWVNESWYLPEQLRIPHKSVSSASTNPKQCEGLVLLRVPSSPQVALQSPHEDH